MEQHEDIQRWLAGFVRTPATAFQSLLLGRAGVWSWSKTGLGEIFTEIFSSHAQKLDYAVNGCLKDWFMQPPPENTPVVVWAVHLDDVFRGIAGLDLPKVAILLRERLDNFRLWLRPYRQDESCDPESSYLAALAQSSANRHLEGLWWKLALRQNGEPAWYTDIGLLGLCRARDRNGLVLTKPSPLFFITLLAVADTGISQEDWSLTTMALMGKYKDVDFAAECQSATWLINGPAWLTEVLRRIAG